MKPRRDKRLPARVDVDVGQPRMAANGWTIGVDLGGTKVEAARIDVAGRIQQRLRRHTDASGGREAVESEIEDAVRELLDTVDSPPSGVGVGVAGQVEASTGVVRFAPNLDWRDVPLQDDLERALDLPVVVTNDVRAATWGEWLHGAGQHCDDLVCLFVGTGIGGGVVSGGRMLTGCSNSAGELGHLTVDLHGPHCHCGNRGCLEALAGGWAIARRARQAVDAEPDAGASLLALVDGKTDKITAKQVAEAFRDGDPLAQRLVDEVADALVAGAVGLVNAYNPCRLILGGGVIEGLPSLVGRIDEGIHERALQAASESLQTVSAQLHNDAGVVGAAALARHRAAMRLSTV